MQCIFNSLICVLLPREFIEKFCNSEILSVENIHFKVVICHKLQSNTHIAGRTVIEDLWRRFKFENFN